MSLRFATTLALSVLIWGCASAEGAYEDGMELEVSGDYAAAANAYALALERDPTLGNVSGRLAVAGREAVRRWITQAGASDPVEAADSYLAADALIRRASGVGVDLERPASFAANRDAALAAAVDALYDRADREIGARGYPAALSSLDRARRYRPSPAQQAGLDALARDAHAGWADADYAAGSYRSAYARAHQALALYPTDDPGAVSLLRLLDDIVADGTLVAVVFPAEPAGDLPRGFLRDVDDVLNDDALAAPPPLLAFVDPVEVRRVLRQSERGGGRTPIRTGGHDLFDSPRRASSFARDLGADLGVAVELGPLVETRTEGEPRAETARLRGDRGPATYQRRRISLEMTADAAIVVVDAVSRQVVCSDEVRQRASDRYDTASYRGDWRDLDLSRSERALFADDADEVAAARLLDQLRDETAAALAASVVRCLERRIA